MTPQRTLLVMLLFLGGCGGCQHDDGAGGAAGTSAAARPSATAAPLQARSKIEAVPAAPGAGARPGGLPTAVAPGSVQATPIVPPANPESGDAGTPPPPEENEGDCIVVADADPDYGPPPLAVTFSAEAECNAGQPTYKWTFGDGTAPSPEANPTHTYAQPGDYTASVTITGPGGSTASDEVDITVEEGEPEPQE